MEQIERQAKTYQVQDLRVKKISKNEKKNKQNINLLAKKIIRVLKKKKLWLGIIESCTGGGLANSITNIAHASEILKGARIVYSDEEKIKHGVAKSLIKKYSVYSPEIALALACQARRKIYLAKIGVGITGQFNGVGEVYAAVVFGRKFLIKKFQLPALKKRSAAKAMVIYQVLKMILGIL